MTSKEATSILEEKIQSNPVRYIQNSIAKKWRLVNTETPPDKQVNANTIIEGVLKHDSGSLVQIVPVETIDNQSEIEKYDAHKIRVSDRYSSSSGFITWSKEAGIDEAGLIATKSQSEYELDLPTEILAEGVMITTESESQAVDVVCNSIVEVVLLVVASTMYIDTQHDTQATLQQY